MNTVMVRQSIKIAFMYLHSQSVGKETNSYCLEMSYEMNSHYILRKIIFGPLKKKKTVTCVQNGTSIRNGK